MQAVARGQADIGLSAYEGVFSGVAFLPWREDRLVVVCRAGHPLASRGSVEFRECAPYEFAGLASSSAMQRFVFERAREAGFEISPRIQIDSQSVLMSMVSTGVGIGVVSRSAFERSRAAGLAAVEIRDAWAARHLRIALPDGPRDNHPALEDFIAQLRRPPAAGGREG
ncbi:MAG: hypothetical protein HUK26_08080 [Duodenibacillus sp.]|nr:hypothetical protein [Duodenibacillus sp.]